MDSPEPDISVFRTDRPGIRKVLGDLEAEIMEFIWTQRSGAGTTVRDVFQVFYQRRHMAYTTIMNTMTRLAKKKLLRVEQGDRGYIYYANFTEEEFISRFVERILEDLLVSFSGATLKSIEGLADPRAAARAQQLVDEIARRRAAEEHE